MGYPAIVPLRILQGATFEKVNRWGVGPFIYKPIIGATRTAPLVLTVTDHELVDGWWIAIAGVKGMIGINSKKTPPGEDDYVQVGVQDSSHLSINSINASGLPAYSGSGTIQYATPVDLAGFSARMQVRDDIMSESVLLTLSSDNGRIIIDNVDKTITLLLSAVDTAAISWVSAVYDLEMMSSVGVVTRLMSGKIAVSREITR